MEQNNLTHRIGMISSLIAGICTTLFAVCLVFSFSYDTSKYSYLVCLILSISYLVLANALYTAADTDKKVFGRISAAFAAVYTVFICLTYYIQLTVVSIGSMQGEALKILQYTPGSWLFAVDMLGYVFMCLSTLAAAFLFKGKGLEGWIKGLFIANGAIALPTFIFPMLPILNTAQSEGNASTGGTYALIVWCLLFAPACFLTVRYFRLKLLPAGAVTDIQKSM